MSFLEGDFFLGHRKTQIPSLNLLSVLEMVDLELLVLDVLMERVSLEFLVLYRMLEIEDLEFLVLYGQ